MKLSKLATKLSLSLKKLRVPKHVDRHKEDESVAQRCAATPEADNEVIERSMLAAMEIQSSSIFHLPNELFLEIFSHFPILKWSELYYRYTHAWYTPIPDIYGERIQTLVALSSTCKVMRHKFLPQVWERSLICLRRWRRSDEIPSRLQLQCRALLGDRCLAAHVKIMTIDLACDGTEGIFNTFINCLATLPNLHTLEVISMGTHYSDPLREALIGVKLPQIRTLILPSMAHYLLRHCPNVDDLTCTPFRPNEEFIQSLIAGKQKLRRFAVLFPGNAIAWMDLARVFPDINEFSVVFWDNVPGDTENCITSLKKLSTLQIIYLVPHHDMVPFCNLGLTLECFREQARYQKAFREKMEKKSEDQWNEMKQLAAEHLRSCSSSGPKLLRTIVLDHDRMSGMHFHSVANMEELEV